MAVRLLVGHYVSTQKSSERRKVVGGETGEPGGGGGINGGIGLLGGTLGLTGTIPLPCKPLFPPPLAGSQG